MSTDISSSLNEHQRTALLAYYLGQYVPNSDDNNLVTYVQTPDDVYEYLLIDPLVTNAVPTSAVAQAISSIQQYINGITLNMEPGYDTKSLDPDQINQWKEGMSQYDIWGGEVELDMYPEDYIDPTLRQNKTEYFTAFESSINQRAINQDTVQQAVMGYLNKFETVANLDIISGYIDGDDQTKDKYYILGKTQTAPNQYFWRSFDMSLNDNNVMSNTAWSEWYAMNTSINEDALVGLPRLLCFNNRLYLFWFEMAISGKEAKEDSSGTTAKEFYTISAYSSYCDFSNTWSAPNLLAKIDSQNIAVSGSTEEYCKKLFSAAADKLYTSAVYIKTIDNVNVSLYTDPTDSSNLAKGFSDFSLQIDYWSNVKVVRSSSSGATSDLAFVLNTYAYHQNKIEVAYTASLYEVSYVGTTSTASYDDFDGQALPVLYTSNFALKTNADGTFDITITIPQKFDTSWYTTSTFKDVAISAAPQSTDHNSRGTFSGVLTTNRKEAILTNGKIQNSKLSSSTYFYTYVAISSGGWFIWYPKSSFNPGVSIINGTVTFPTPDGIAKSSPNEPLPTNKDCSICLQRNGDHADLVPFSFPKDQVTWDFWVVKDSWNGTVIKRFGPQENFYPSSDNFVSSLHLPAFTGESEVINIAYGYQTSASKKVYVTYPVTVSLIKEIKPSPDIKSSTDNNLGTAIYLNFAGSTFPTSNVAIANIRLNTLFARELINKASVSLNDLLNWNTQLTTEPGMGTSTPDVMDFNGANGIYFWELFFYMPYLVAYRLYQEQGYVDALNWYNYIFDPAARGRVSSNSAYPQPNYWNVRPLVENVSLAAQGRVAELTADPDAIALADPVHYQKAVFMAYVKTMVAAADNDYRLLTNDGLGLAKLRYVQAKDLLGPRPDVAYLNAWEPERLEVVAGRQGDNLPLLQYENTAGDLAMFASASSVALTVGVNDHFKEPLNTQLLQYWDLIDSRLYNLRHYLSINGDPLHLALYATPINPTLLMQQSVQGGSLTSAANAVVAAVPPYRFRVMLQSATSAAATLSQLGQSLLSYCERFDGASLQELEQQQLLDISAFTLTLQQNAIDALDKDQQALTTSKDLAQGRLDYYQSLKDNGISTEEQRSLDEIVAAEAQHGASVPPAVAGAALDTAPNIFGFSMGGSKWGAVARSTSTTLQISAAITMLESQKSQTSAGYDRRGEEWEFQISQAKNEIKMINQQLDALTVRQTGAQTALQQAQAQQKNIQSTLNFLTTRFTQSSLYSWLSGQLSALYYQAYDAVLSLCLSTQSAWQYEMGDITSRFIQTNAWNDSYRGFLVGETLQLNLRQMESAWLSRNVRRLELTKTLSLKQLLNDTAVWNKFISSGAVDFSITEAMLDDDYPGHYLRQLAFVTLTIPALIGPYQDVRITLTQTSSSVLLKADLDGVKYLNDDGGTATNILTNPRANQQIALSSGLNDSGLFALNFGDERYLPFEGTGVISRWHLAFPNASSAEQKALLASLNDVIVQLHYTAIDGGSTFAKSVSALK